MLMPLLSYLSWDLLAGGRILPPADSTDIAGGAPAD
jgi:hypothetical protein